MPSLGLWIDVYRPCNDRPIPPARRPIRIYIVLYKVTREWRKLHNEELNDVVLAQYFSGYKIENNEMGGACSVYGGRRGIYRILVGKPEGQSPLGRPRLR
jgi:hypothetical protein